MIKHAIEENVGRNIPHQHESDTMSNELVTVVTYSNYLNAEMYKMWLESQGIPCIIKNGTIPSHTEYSF